MNIITFNAHYGQSIVSTLIRWFSRGRYNHISIQLNSFVYEAKEGKGVIKTLLSKWDDSTVVESRTFKIDDRQEQMLFEFLEEQVGKKYDYKGIVSFLWGFKNPVTGAWFCSELAFVVLAKLLGLKSSEYDNQKVSPHIFWIILRLIKC